jgi:hypothetical protein
MATGNAVTVHGADGRGAAASAARTRGLLRGNPDLNARRRPPLPQRVGAGAAAVLGPEVGELVRDVLEGIKRGALPAQAGRLVLERVLPPGRPVRLGLPRIHGPEDLMLAEDLIGDALDAGEITVEEARGLQDYVLCSWRARREAQEAWDADPDNYVDEATARAEISKAAARFGMVWPKGEMPPLPTAAERRRL